MSFFYKLFTSRGLFSKNFRGGFIFLGFCHHHHWRDTSKGYTITMHVGYANNIGEKYPCMHPPYAPHPMHTWPPLHATTWVTPIWLTEYPCMWLRQSLWRNIDSPCAPANTSGEMPLIYRVNRQFSP